MISFVRFITVLFAVVAVNPIASLETGDFYRPSADEMSGIAGTNATYRRSPCPALNALANHGYLPRGGINVTEDVLHDVLMSVYSLDETSTQILLALVPSMFSLDYLGTHNLVEHDASLVHTDAYFGEDPASVNETMVDDLLGRSIDGKTVGVTEVAAARANRLANCIANNPECTFSASTLKIAYIEASIFILGFGGNVNESVGVDVARAFMSEERIPEEYVVSSTVISFATNPITHSRIHFDSLTPTTDMVSFANCITAATFAVSAFITSPVEGLDVNLLPEGTYFKPSGRLVSGVVGNTAAFHRSPCPAVNALANHGYLPRNGQNITKAVLGPAVMAVYNLDEASTATLLALVPDTFSLDYLATHNVIEHDASLIHDDEYFGGDPAKVDNKLASDLLERGEASGKLGVTELAAARKARLADSIATNPNVTFGTTQQTLAYTEASILLLGFGAKTNESVSLDVARSFLVDEKIPNGWARASSAITVAEVRATVANIIAATTA
ncbi:hypothetical protein BBO99_00006239 [Phytophthora kernoviae]|uniref:Heme haloperoxidase family profile domain-containing protein n=1 Tax=Phytophthora kernoviae TaxID=325452 RepID=A0A3R7J5V0_9STRA|nr:hypothetical protein BBI17_006343 [Phytophthora kernoviae]RLN78046.1 hypothetical protein BBO99_00006239 [Phytophthora kernoviae]